MMMGSDRTKDAKLYILELLDSLPHSHIRNVETSSNTISQIDHLLSSFTVDQRIRLLNSEWNSNSETVPTRSRPLLLRCIIHMRYECVQPHNELSQMRVSLICKLCQLFLFHGLDPSRPIWDVGQPEYQLLQNSGLRQFDGSSQPDAWTWSIFSSLAECLQHHIQESLIDVYSLIFDIVSAMKKDTKRYPRLKPKSFPALVTLPIWTRPIPFESRIHSQRLNTVWTHGSAVVSMFAGYGHPIPNALTPSLLQLSWDVTKSSIGQQFIRIVDMNSVIGTERRYDLFMPSRYDHHFVINSNVPRSLLIETINRILAESYHDIIVPEGDGLQNSNMNEFGFCRHRSIIVYLFILKQFHDHQKRLFIDKVEALCRRRGEGGKSLPLLFDLVHLIIDEYCFDDLSFIDTELNGDQLLCVWLTQCHRLSKEWQDWMADHVVPRFKNRELDTLRSLVTEHPHLVHTVVMRRYDNDELSQFVRGLHTQ